MSPFVFIKVNIHEIQSGDTILHNGKETTVCRKDIRRCNFMGLSIFGDTYNGGEKPVLKGFFNETN